MTASISQLLRQTGPALSSEIIDRLVKDGVSPSAARQRIARGQSEYVRLAGLRFAKNARFIYLDDQYGDKRFWDAIERAFKTSGISYWAAVAGLKARGGSCPKSLFVTACGAPAARKRQLSPERVLERLTAINLLGEENDGISDIPWIRFRPNVYEKDSSATLTATLLAENTALLAIRDWARKIGLGSYNKFRTRGDAEAPIVSGITWDLSAPCYLRPLVSARAGAVRPAFFVCDVNLRAPVDDDFVSVIVRKHDLASAPANVAPIFPLLVAEVYTQAAFDLARKSGIAATTVSGLFGIEIAKALRDLIDMLSDAGATAAVNPDHLYQVMASLTKIEGAANNIRGALFELAIGNLVKDVEQGYVVIGQRWLELFSRRWAEIDVLLDRPDGKPVLVVECKAKIPGARVSRDEVKKWFSDRVPLIHKALIQDDRYKGRKFDFQLWSNGPFHAAAADWLGRQITDFGDHSVGWKDGTALKAYAAKSRSGAIKKILNEHYFLHPLSKLAKAKKSA